MKLLRDPKTGRFRRPTDEERWPDPVERARVQRIRSYFNNPMIIAATMEVLAQRLEDIKFVSGAQWPRK